MNGDSQLPGKAAPAPNHTANGRVRFGTYEVDVHAGELRKSGLKIKLHGQPFEVLIILLERPGEVVTREELQKKLWASDTFVDFEHGLNKAINRLREALNDNAESPRYIETLPRRGYRFVAPIAHLEAQQAPHASPRLNQANVPATGKSRLWALGTGVAAVGVILVAGWGWVRSLLPEPRVLDYQQLTSDRHLKGTSCDGATSRLVTDGARVFFSEGGLGLMQVSTKGGEIGRVTNPIPCFAVSDISPDKTELLGTSILSTASQDQPLWSLSIASGLARRIGNLNGHAAVWSPDGQRVAFATGRFWDGPNDVYIAGRDGGEPTKLTHIERGSVSSMAWSPDETTLRLTSAGNIWEVLTSGANLHLVQLESKEACCASMISYTPEGKYLLIGSERFGLSGATWLLRNSRPFPRTSTKNLFNITVGAMDFLKPALSPDRKQIFAIGGRARGELVLYDLKFHRFEPYLSGISAEHLDFSRDGKWVTYVTYPEGILWRSRVDGTDRLQLTTPPLRVILPHWSPDGNRIAFSGRIPRGIFKTYVVWAQGGKPEVVSESQGDQVDVTWMPDGNTLIFSDSQTGSRRWVSSFDLKTGKVTELPGSDNKYGTRVSPDGRYIVAGSTQGTNQLFLFNLLRREWSELRPRDNARVGWEHWSRDSQFVYFLESSMNGTQAVCRIRVADHKKEIVAALEVSGGMIGVFGPWVGGTPDESPLFLRDLSVQEIYSLDLDLR